jgi:predicted permease
MLRELLYAFRTLRKSPGFTIAAVMTLALTIGANSTIFSVIEGVLLRPLPFDREGRLVEVNARDAQGQRQFVSQPDLDDWRATAKSFDGLASWVPQSVSLTGLDQPERVIGMFVLANFLPVLGITPAIGRGFAASEDRIGAERVVLLGDQLWHTRFAGDPSVLGKTIQLNGETYTIVGVLPASFVFPDVIADVYLPAFKYPNYSINRAQTSCSVIGRLRPGTTLQSAQAEMDSIAARLAASYPATNSGRGVKVVSLRNDIVDRRKPTIFVLAGAAAFVLLIGCANIAGLLIARMVARERDRAVRIALGASRARLISQVTTEVLLLAVAGGALGFLLAAWTVPVVAASIAVFLPFGIVIALDRSVVLFAAGVSLISAIAIAVIPAWQSANGESLRAGRSAGSGAGSTRTRSILVVAEIALALVLLAGAGLMMKSVASISREQPGFDPHNLLTLGYRVPRTKYPTGAQQAEFHREVVEKIKAVPGVIDAAAVRATPLGSNGDFTDFLLTDRPEPAVAERPRAHQLRRSGFLFDHAHPTSARACFQRARCGRWKLCDRRESDFGRAILRRA